MGQVSPYIRPQAEGTRTTTPDEGQPAPTPRVLLRVGSQGFVRPLKSTLVTPNSECDLSTHWSSHVAVQALLGSNARPNGI